MSPLTRRALLTGTAAVGAGTALPLAWASPSRAATPHSPAGADDEAIEPTEVRWLDGAAPAEMVGATWGVPWPKGQVQPSRAFALHTPDGVGVPMQSWPIGYWPDGSLKWSAHAVQ